MNTQTFDPKIYVACLASYNNGILHGKWIDAARDAEEIRDDIQSMLKESMIPLAEEYAIHDYSDFAGIKLREWENLDDVSAFAKAINEHENPYVLSELHELLGNNDISTTIEYYEDNYRGEYDSIAEFAEQFYLDCHGEIPESLRYYIDWQAMGRDMEINGDIFVVAINHKYHVFWNE